MFYRVMGIASKSRKSLLFNVEMNHDLFNPKREFLMKNFFMMVFFMIVLSTSFMMAEGTVYAQQTSPPVPEQSPNKPSTTTTIIPPPLTPAVNAPSSGSTNGAAIEGSVQGVSAGGEKQTTVIDENGNLKIIDKKNPGSQPWINGNPPGSSTTSPPITSPGMLQSAPTAPTLPTQTTPNSSDSNEVNPTPNEAQPESNSPNAPVVPNSAPKNSY